MPHKIEWTQYDLDIVVPSIEGRLLCSVRDPRREAKSWWVRQLSQNSQVETVVILGLGAGFHVAEVLQAENRPALIFIVEREKEIIQKWQKRNPLLASEVQFLPVGDELEIQPPVDVTIAEFRPAWAGHEKFYERLSESLHGKTIHQIVAGLNQQDQSEEAKIWRALREFVA